MNVLMSDNDCTTRYRMQNQLFKNAVQNQGVQNIGNQNGKLVFQNIGKEVCSSTWLRTVQSEPKEKDACLIFQTQLLIAQKEEQESNSKRTDLLDGCLQQIFMKIHNHWSYRAHPRDSKILKEENFPIINQVDSRLQNFEIQFLKEAAKFVRDFKSLAKEADESLAKHKTLELEIERLLRAVVSQDIMSIVQNPSVVDSSNLPTT
ncbi:hypothetical protein Tco_0493568 [Tanacetum coccineum]